MLALHSKTLRGDMPMPFEFEALSIEEIIRRYDPHRGIRAGLRRLAEPQPERGNPHVLLHHGRALPFDSFSAAWRYNQTYFAGGGRIEPL
jgi:hypothetical protein